MIVEAKKLVREGESMSFEWTLNLLHLYFDCWRLLKVEVNKKEEQLFLQFSFTKKKNSLFKEVQARVSMRVYKLISKCCVLSSTPYSLAPNLPYDQNSF